MSTQNQSLRLLVVVSRYHPYMGGLETHVSEVCRRLAQAGINVCVLTTDPSRQLPREEDRDGVHILRVPAWPTNRDYYFAPDIYRTIIQGKWDIMHCQGYHTLVPPLAMLAALRAHLPYVVTFHGGGHSSWLRNTFRKPQLALLRPLLVQAKQLIAIARFEIEFYGKQLHVPSDRFVLIPNGADLPSIAQEKRKNVNGTVIASVGRLERYKGHHRILAALPKILEQQPDVRLSIIGTGPYERTLQRMAADLGVADRVEIRGISPTNRAEMVAVLMSASLVTLLSEYETHPIAVLEALALQRPVLVADTSGMRELVEHGMARAVPLTSTPAQVATAVLDQLCQPLIPPNISLPTWDECASGLLELYQAVVRKSITCVS